MELNIVINIDDNYIQHAMAMLCSLFDNNESNLVNIHVLTKGLTQESEEKVTALADKYSRKLFIYNVNDEILNGVQFRKTRPLTKAAYYRLLISEIIPISIDKILYLDCDLIVLDDISEIFKFDLSNYALAATLDDFPLTNQHRLQLNMEADQKTFCSGVMLINLKYWRENKVTEDLIKYAKKEKVEVHFHDQDVLNYLFKNKWFLLPPKWNRIATDTKIREKYRYRKFDLADFYERPKIIHYANLSTKPWQRTFSPCRNVYRKYLVKSGYSPKSFSQIQIAHAIKLSLITLKYNIIIRIRKTFKLY